MKKYDLVVVGSGAGFIVLDAALERGLQCALIEKDQLGGTCLNRGCIPSKMLVYPADLIREAQRSDKVGVSFGKPKADWEKIGSRMWQQINQHNNIRRDYEKVPNLNLYFGTGEFTGRKTMRVKMNEGGWSQPFEADKFVLTAGARSKVPDIAGLQEVECLTYETFFGDKFPKKPWESLIIIGGGVIGTEFAHIFSAMGTKVTVIGRAPHLLRGEEEEVSEAVEDQFRAFGIDMLLGHAAISVKKTKNGKKVVTRCTRTGKSNAVEAEEVLLASGVTSNADLLRCDLAGIEVDENGWIVANEYMETNQPDIWALGDITGRYQLRHKANYEADILAGNLFGNGEKRAADYTKVPWAVFTCPQVARVGMTEKEAREKGLKVFVGRNDYSQVASGFAMAYSDGDVDNGFVKIIAGERGELLGVHIAGYQAAALVQPFVYLLNAATIPHVHGDHLHYSVGTFEPILQSMVIHPALSELTAWALDNIDWLVGEQENEALRG